MPSLGGGWFMVSRYACRPASMASERLSFWRPRTSLLLSTHSEAVCLKSPLRCLRKSVPSPAFVLRNSRVSSPDFGASRIPIPTPTPRPKRKLESPFLSILFSPLDRGFSSWHEKGVSPQPFPVYSQ